MCLNVPLTSGHFSVFWVSSFQSFQSLHRFSRGNWENYGNRELRVTFKAIGCILVLLLSIKLS